MNLNNFHEDYILVDKRMQDAIVSLGLYELFKHLTWSSDCMTDKNNFHRQFGKRNQRFGKSYNCTSRGKKLAEKRHKYQFMQSTAVYTLKSNMKDLKK